MFKSDKNFMIKFLESERVNFKKVDRSQKYLGSFIDEEPHSRKIFDIIFEKLQSQLEGWQSRLLSQPARAVLIKSVLSSLPLYHLSYFKLTDKEAKKCDSLMCNFFWGTTANRKSPHMRSWDKLCAPRDTGGLGIKKTKEFNNAMLGRQAWRIIHNNRCLLSTIYQAKYGTGDIGSPFMCKSTPSTLARPICNRINEILRDCHWRVGNGNDIRLSSSLWLPPDRPNPDFATVSNLLDGNERWDRSKVLDIYDLDKAERIMKIPISLIDIADRVVWTASPQGNYTVKDAYNLATTLGHHQSHFNWKTFWKLKCLQKILMFGWKCLLDSLPLGANLIKKNFNIDPNCAFCHDHLEDLDHLFLGCTFTRASWFGSDFSQGLTHWLHNLMCNDLDYFVKILVFVWTIYCHRNEVRFNGSQPDHNTIFRRWKTTMLQINDLKHYRSQPPAKDNFNLIRRPHGNMFDQDQTLHIAWHRSKSQNKNVVGIFHFSNHNAVLDFYLNETSSTPITCTVLKAIRHCMVNLRSSMRRSILFRSQKGLFQGNRLKAQNFEIEVLARDINNFLEDDAFNWQIDPEPHHFQLQDAFPSILSFINCCISLI